MDDIQFSKRLSIIAKIADRADAKIVEAAGGRTAFMMDIAAADGCNGNRPLDLHGLLAADEFNFLHDVCGISRHMDRDTGKLGGHFSPRFSRQTA